MAEINLVIKANPSQGISAVKEFNNTLKDTSKESVNSQKAIGDLTDDLSFMGVNVGQLTGAFTNKVTALGKVTKAFGALRVAIAATGIGALVIAITSLIAYFTKTEKGAELLERAMAGLSAVFDVISGVVSKVGEALISAFNNPKQAMIDLANFVKQNLINRFTAFKVILDGILDLDFKKLNNGLLQAATGVENSIDKMQKFGSEVAKAANEAIKIKREFQALEDATRENSIALSKNQIEIDKLLAKSKNRTLSEKERIDLLKQAGELEKANLNSVLALSEKEVSIIERENELKRQNGTLRDEDEQKLADAINKRNALIGSSTALQERIEGRLDQLRQQGEEKRLKAIEDRTKKEEEAAKKAEEIEKAKQEAIQKALEGSQSGLKITQKLTEQSFKEAEISLKNHLVNKEITQEQFDERMKELKLQALRAQLNDLEQYNGFAGDLDLELRDKQIEIDNFVTENKLQNLNKIKKQEDEDAQKEKDRLAKKLQITEEFTSAVGDIIGQSITETGFDLEQFNKKFLILLLDTAEKVLFTTVFKTTAESLASAGSIATGGVAGLIKAAIITGLIKGAFSVLKSQINQFHDGGFTGRGGEWDIAGNVHKNEFVHTQEKTKKHRRLFEAIHNDSPVHMADIAKLLDGTGVIMRPEISERINSMHEEYGSRKSGSSKTDKDIADIKKTLKAQFEKQNSKPDEKVLPDGTRVIRTGNTTRIIRKI